MQKECQLRRVAIIFFLGILLASPRDSFNRNLMLSIFIFTLIKFMDFLVAWTFLERLWLTEQLSQINLLGASALFRFTSGLETNQWSCPRSFGISERTFQYFALKGKILLETFLSCEPKQLGLTLSFSFSAPNSFWWYSVLLSRGSVDLGSFG